jgi:hypothetical protein
LYGLGQAEAQAGSTALKTLGDIGTQELGYEQSKIEAPLTRAQNIAKLLQGYQFPMTVNKTEEQLPSAFAPSAIQQIGSLGTLVGASFNSKGTGAGDRFLNFIGNTLGGSSNPNFVADPGALPLGKNWWD